MLETWIQWTCDGCEITDTYPAPHATKAEVRAQMKLDGWQHVSSGASVTGGLDYCSDCIVAGRARKRIVSWL